MKQLIKWRWLTSALVILAVALLVFAAPNLVKLANEKGQITAPEGSSFKNYEHLMEDIGENKHTISAVVTLDDKIDASSKAKVKSFIKDIEDIKHVDKVTSPFLSKEVERKLVSKDKKHILIPITTTKSEDETSEAAKEIRKLGDKEFKSVNLTGNSLVIDDINDNTIKGLQKTEIITLVLIITILVLVFRSVVAPFVPLLIVGLAYMASQGVLAFLIRDFDFPTSNYIQSFLVAILFGIGTDYCILILNRYREELAKGKDKFDATVTSFETSGKTILIAALTVLVGFAALFFVEFNLFRSAVGIAIAVVIMLIVMFTVLPVIMILLGEKIFWPSKNVGHRDNKLWGKLGEWSYKRPALMMLIPLIITVSAILFTNNKISYDATNEISDQYDSVKAINIINDNFSKGMAFPVEMVLKDDDSFVTVDRLPELETLAKAIEKVDGVKSVNTITRPSGEPIEDLTVTSQLAKLHDNLDQTVQGITKVDKGLNEMKKQVTPLTNAERVQQMAMAASGAPQNMPKMIDDVTRNAKALEQGLTQSSDGLKKITSAQNKINDYLSDIADSKTVDSSGIYLTDDILKDKDFKQSIDMYSYDDGKVARMQIELSSNPYSRQAIDILSDIKSTVNNQVHETSLEDSKISYGGMTSSNSDLKHVIDKDMNTTILLMTAGLFLILIVFMKSIVMPLYMTISILLTYYASIGISNLIFGQEGLAMMVPFFSFVLIMTLGVDYAIFLVTRFNEEYKGSIHDALITAMKKMGVVIMVAAVILIGTFAALISSGALTLIQISTTVIIGLVLYNLIMLPIFIPSLISTFGKGNWWPFKQHDRTDSKIN